MAKRDYYDVLGVAPNASDDDIKKAWRKMAMKYHPDRHSGADPRGVGKAEETFKEAKEAYEMLSDPAKRAAYDQFSHAGVDRSAFTGAGADSWAGGNPQPGRDQVEQEARRNLLRKVQTAAESLVKIKDDLESRKGSQFRVVEIIAADVRQDVDVLRDPSRNARACAYERLEHGATAFHKWYDSEFKKAQAAAGAMTEDRKKLTVIEDYADNHADVCHAHYSVLMKALGAIGGNQSTPVKPIMDAVRKLDIDRARALMEPFLIAKTGALHPLNNRNARIARVALTDIEQNLGQFVEKHSAQTGVTSAAQIPSFLDERAEYNDEGYYKPRYFGGDMVATHFTKATIKALMNGKQGAI